jgi:hypothetical protein
VARGASNASGLNAVSLVNDLRERAGLGRDVGTSNGPSLTPEFILEERGRELFWEAHRRTDLIRFGQFTSNEKTWAWKGGVEDGTGVSSDLRLYPIPSSELNTNPNMTQNPGY